MELLSDDLYFEIIKYLSIKEIVYLSSLSWYHRTLLTSEKVYKYIAEKEYIIGLEKGDDDWKDYYKIWSVLDLPPTKIILRDNDTYKDIVQKGLYRSMSVNDFYNRLKKLLPVINEYNKIVFIQSNEYKDHTGVFVVHSPYDFIRLDKNNIF